MRQVYSILLLIVLGSFGARAQSFSMESGDTVYVNACTAYTKHNNVHNLSTGNVILEWKVIENTYPGAYPDDWDTTLGICDNKTCLSGADIAIGHLNESLNYTLTPTPIGDFHITGDLAGTTTSGPYVVRVRLNNKAIPTDTAIATFIVGKCFLPNGVEDVNAVIGTVALYPNPAASVVSVVYNTAAQVTSIAIYDIRGKQMSVQAAPANSANISVESMPSGIYFVRLLNKEGNVVATRKFTRQ